MLLWVGWQCRRVSTKTQPYNFSENPIIEAHQAEQKKFSILIPLRNEASNLKELCHSLDQLNYPNQRFEVLFIDDHSEDISVRILKKLIEQSSFSSRIIRLTDPEHYGKKQAITIGIKQAKYPWIITLDADSTVSKDWLSSIERSLQDPKLEFVAGPVLLKSRKGVLFQLQFTEFMALQALTRASFSARPLLSNGTNLVYSKKIFEAVSGFLGNINISSGDDMFLMKKIGKHQKSCIGYNNDWAGAVSTKSPVDWKDYAAQQIRWMSKTAALKDPVLWLVALIIFITNSLLAIYWAMSIAIAILDFSNALGILKFTILFFVLKFTIDHLMLFLSFGMLVEPTVKFIEKINWPKQVAAAWIYPFWSAGLTLFSLFYRPNWKGRPIQTK